ncbi:MAG: hypothetical protein Fur007_15360 [Rhodoferax sp.]
MASAQRALAAHAYADAQAQFSAVIRQQPNNAAAWLGLGRALYGLQNLPAALQCFESAAQKWPESAEHHAALADVLMAMGLHARAVTALDAALRRNPGQPRLYVNKFTSLRALGAGLKAMACLDEAFERCADKAELYVARANFYEHIKNEAQALSDLAQAWALNPDLPCLTGRLLKAKDAVCDWIDTEQPRQTLQRQVVNGLQATSPWDLLTYCDDPALQRACAARHFAELMQGQSVGQAWPARDRGRGRLRIGYFSSDFTNHPVMHLLRGVLAQHDRSQFEIYAFSFGPDAMDNYQRDLKPYFDKFYKVSQFSDADVVQLARDLEIDVAVDLLGYTGQCKPRLFGLRCAPVQINFLGYAGTLGSAAWDYIVADAVLIPPEARPHYAEKVIELPGSFQPNDDTKPVAEATPSRASLGLPEHGFVFCCSNNLYKISPAVFAQWMQLLQAVPGSVLWLFTGKTQAQANLAARAQSAGVDPARLVFAGFEQDQATHLARYKAADLFLDTFPYNAHTTASDALWAGLPVLTRPGQSYVSRVAASLLHALALPELVATSESDYGERALRLARDPDELNRLRARLHQNRSSQPLFQTRRYTGNLERAYRAAFDRWQQGLAPDHLVIEAQT